MNAQDCLQMKERGLAATNYVRGISVPGKAGPGGAQMLVARLLRRPMLWWDGLQVARGGSRSDLSDKMV